MTNNCEIDDKIFYNKYNYPNLFFIVKKKHQQNYFYLK